MHRIARDTRGVYSIAPTPFHDDGSLDVAGIDRLAAFYDAAGVDGLTVLGQMGEAPKLSSAESLLVARRFVERAGRPVVVGVTAPGFETMRELAHEVMDHGAAGVMVAPPTSLRTDDQIVGYYTQVAERLGPDVPLVVQDYPLTFSVVMSVPVLVRIASTIDSAVMLKHEDWPGLEKISALREAEAAGRAPRLSILCGNGGLFLDFEVERGADGAMTGYCFPELLVDVVASVAAGRRDDAHDRFDAHLPLIRYEQQPGVGLAVRKHVLVRRGVLGSATMRQPGRALSTAERAEVDYLLERLREREPAAELVA